VQRSSRLALFHYWVAFATFLPAVLLGAWQMLVRSPLPAPLDDSAAYYASVTLHGTAMAYVVTTFFTMGFWLCRGCDEPRSSDSRRDGLLDWIRHLPGRHGDGGCHDSLRPGLGALYLLPAADGERLVLRGRVPAHRRLNDLGRGNDPQHDGVEKRDNPGALSRFRCSPSPRPQYCGRGPATGVLLELVGILLPAGLRLERSDRRRIGAYSVFRDPARHRLFLADAGLYCLLYAGTVGCRRADVQRHHGAARLHYATRLFASRRDASSLHGPRTRSGFKFLQTSLTFLVVLPTLLTVFRPARAWKSQGASGAVADFLGGSQRCPGTSRWCWRSDCRS